MPVNRRRYYLFCLLARLIALAVLAAYALLRPAGFLEALTGPILRLTPLTVVWLALIGSMVMRLLPSRLESLGCQKLFAHRACLTGTPPPPSERRQADRGALGVLALWLAVNGILAVLWAAWGRNLLLPVLLAGFYGVCDIICILFYCPFQAWIMHNRCCTTCRIFDWDYLMLCTPLMVVPGLLARSACLLAAVIFLRWEMVLRRHPERFYESGNSALRCAACQEQLCRYKRILSANLRR